MANNVPAARGRQPARRLVQEAQTLPALQVGTDRGEAAPQSREVRPPAAAPPLSIIVVVGQPGPAQPL